MENVLLINGRNTFKRKIKQRNKITTQAELDERTNHIEEVTLYWLNLHQFADTMDISILNNLLEEHCKELETLD